MSSEYSPKQPPHPPPLGIEKETCSHPTWEVSSGSELDNEINRDSTPPMKILTAILCEYFKIWQDINNVLYIACYHLHTLYFFHCVSLL